MIDQDLANSHVILDLPRENGRAPLRFQPPMALFPRPCRPRGLSVGHPFYLSDSVGRYPGLAMGLRFGPALGHFEKLRHGEVKPGFRHPQGSFNRFSKGNPVSLNFSHTSPISRAVKLKANVVRATHLGFFGSQ